MSKSSVYEHCFRDIFSQNQSFDFSLLKGSRLFISGATGFVGQWFLESLSYFQNYFAYETSLTCLSRDPEIFLKENPHHAELSQRLKIQWIKGDVRDFEIPKQAFDYVIHSASSADLSFVSQNPELVQSCATVGSEQMVKLARESDARSFLLLSSGAVYGKQPNDLSAISETQKFQADPEGPARVYADAKRTEEKICSEIKNLKIARIFALSGPGLPLNRQFALGNFFSDAISGKPIRVLGDGTAVRTYQHIADSIVWMWALLLNGKSGEAYNVGDDLRPLSISELAHLLGKRFNVSVEILGKEKPVTSLKPSFQKYIPDASKIKRELGLKNTLSLERSLEDMIESLRT